MIKDKIEKVIKAGRQNPADTASRQRLADFYDEMNRNGMVIKQEYNLPPLDSIEKRPAVEAIRFAHRHR